VLNRLSSLPPLLNNAQPQISPLSPDRRDLSLPAGRPPRLQRARSQDPAGLGAAAPVFAPFPGVIDVHRLGRQDQDLRTAGRFQQADRLWDHAAAAVADARQQQHQCRRQHGEHRIAGGGSCAASASSVSIEDLRNTMLTQSGGNPVLVKDVASVMVGNQPRLGIAGQDDKRRHRARHRADAPRRTEHAPRSSACHQEVQRINSAGILPPGVQIERILRPQGADRHHHGAPCCTTWCSASG